MSLLEMSVTAGIMVVAVVIIRALTINRLPKKTFLALWAVVLCRLLLPVSLPSPLSVYNAVPAPERLSPLPAAAWLPVLPEAVRVQGAAGAGGQLSWLAVLWALGAAATAVFFLITYLRCCREFREALPVENDLAKGWLAQHPICRRVGLRQSGRISAPLTYGLFRPVILMPGNTDWDSQSQIRYVLSHELYHIRRLDTLWKGILTFALCLHWFNPLVWAMYVLANRDLELSCDESVVRAFGEDSKGEYALTLIGMEERRAMLTPLCNSFSKNAIEERIRALMGQKKATTAVILAALAIVAGVTVAFATSPHTADEPKVSLAPRESQPAVSAAVPPQAPGYSAKELEAQAKAWVENDDEEYGPKLDPQTGHYYTQKQYDLVAAFQNEGHEAKSIAEFNRTVNAMFITDESYEGSFQEAYEALRTDLPLDDALAGFVYYTVDASANEYNTRLSEVYSGKRQDPAFDSRAQRTETANVFGDMVEVGWASADYTVTYRILDQDKLTVAERDKFLLDIVKGMQAWLEGRELKGDTDQSALATAAQTELERLGKAGTTARIEFTGGTVEEAYCDFYHD